MKMDTLNPKSRTHTPKWPLWKMAIAEVTRSTKNIRKIFEHVKYGPIEPEIAESIHKEIEEIHNAIALIANAYNIERRLDQSPCEYHEYWEIFIDDVRSGVNDLRSALSLLKSEFINRLTRGTFILRIRHLKEIATAMLAALNEGSPSLVRYKPELLNIPVWIEVYLNDFKHNFGFAPKQIVLSVGRELHGCLLEAEQRKTKQILNKLLLFAFKQSAPEDKIKIEVSFPDNTLCFNITYIDRFETNFTLNPDSTAHNNSTFIASYLGFCKQLAYHLGGTIDVKILSDIITLTAYLPYKAKKKQPLINNHTLIPYKNGQ